MSKWVFLNDVFVAASDAKLHVQDLSIQRGYGIFDFFKVIRSTPIYLEDHLDRFYFSAQKMRLDVPFSRKELTNILQELIQKNAEPDCGIRLTLTGGYSPDGYTPSAPNLVITSQPLAEVPKEIYEQGISLMIREHQRQLPEVKTIDYLMAIWLQPMLAQEGATDVLYHNRGMITECPRSNFFIIDQDNILVTPRDSVLRGITRKKILEVAGKFMKVEERNIHIDELAHIREAFITSTTKMILPVSVINHKVINDGSRPFTDKLHKALHEYQRNYISGRVAER